MIELFVWLAVGFFSIFGFSRMYYKFSDSNVKINFKIILLYVLGICFQISIQYFDLMLLSVFSYFVYFPILFYNLNKISKRKLLFYIIIIWLYGVLADIFLTLVTSLILFIMNKNLYMDYSVYVSMFLTISSSIVIIFLSCSSKFKDKTNNIFKKCDKIKYTDALLTLLVMFIVVVDVVMVINVSKLDINVLLVLFTIFLILFVMILFKYQLDAREIEEYLKILRENNEFYIRVDDDNRIFKHNLTAKLSSIKSVGNKKTNSLIDDLILQFNKSIDFSSSIKVIPYGLNGIIYQKLYPYLEDLNVKVNNEINYDILAVLKPRRYNVFVEKMMLALDNAIESCLKSNEKALVINIFDDEVNIYVEVENTFASDIDLDLLGTKSYSTKGKRRGLGLFSMFRNNEAKVTVKIINNLFVNKITTKKRLND